MREVRYEDIKSAVAKLAIDACCIQTPDIRHAFSEAKKTEQSALGQNILDTLIENGKIAKDNMMPICQDTGMTVVFVEIGQDVHIVGGYLEDAINEGIRDGYTNGYLR